jgi:RNA polymerase primary sigma factor
MMRNEKSIGEENLNLSEDEKFLLIANIENNIEKEKSIEKLILSQTKLVVKIASGYGKICNVELMDLVSAGTLGLMKSLEKYDSNKANFSTYAYFWINESILKSIKQDSAVKVPSYILNKVAKKIKLESSEDMSKEELMSKLGINESELENLELAQISAVSVDQKISEDGETTIGDIIADPSKETALDILDKEEIIVILKDIVDNLPEMEKNIIQSQILNDNKEKLKDIGDRYGLSGERVRQIKEKTLNEIKSKLKRETE